jgi:hypothetical protein
MLTAVKRPTLAAALQGRLARPLPSARPQRARARPGLSSSDDSLSAAEIALAYKQLKEVERAWRDQKHVLALRPVYHRKEERIRSHCLLCFLALLLVRVAEAETKETWPTIRREFQRMHMGEFEGSAGRVPQRSETTSARDPKGARDRGAAALSRDRAHRRVGTTPSRRPRRNPRRQATLRLSHAYDLSNSG